MEPTESGRIARVCPEHRRVLERADSGEGLMCPAGPRGWHLVDQYVSIDRHTGLEIEEAAVERPEEKSVPKEYKGNACPGCGRPKVGRNARDGQPCARCRNGKPARTRSAPAARSEKPTPEAVEPPKKRTLETAHFADRARTLTLWLIQRTAPKSGGPSFLIRWRIAPAKGAPGRKGRPTKGVAATALTEDLARASWQQVLRKAERDAWTKVELPLKRGRELQIEMFPAAVGKPKRAA